MRTDKSYMVVISHFKLYSALSPKNGSYVYQTYRLSGSNNKYGNSSSLTVIILPYGLTLIGNNTSISFPKLFQSLFRVISTLFHDLIKIK